MTPTSRKHGSPKHGVIAAGSLPTAEAGAQVLQRGGNAVDAAVAACFATSVGEPTLTSLAGGGMLIYRAGDSGRVTVCDCFSDAPRRSPKEVEKLDFVGVDLDFGPTTQRFYIGAGSAAVPGVIPGLCQSLERWGSMPLSEVIKPACQMLRQGFELGPYQGHAARLLEPILTYSDSGRAVFAKTGRMIAEGDTFTLPELADTLEALAREGWRTHYNGVMARAMVAQFGPDKGGLLSAEDLSQYRVYFREPLTFQYGENRVHTVPPPAAGGPMIALMLRLLAARDLKGLTPGSDEHVRLLCHAMAVADEARSAGEVGTSAAALAHYQKIYETRCAQPLLTAAKSPGGPSSTTHISVVDSAGNAAAITFSYGEGNAYMIGNSGIMMNNLMGEEDLHPGGFGTCPRGVRLPTMMSPTVLEHADGSITVLGTGGANRIRTAIVQVISLLTDAGFDPSAAAAFPRVHYEAGTLNAEVFNRDDNGAGLRALGPDKLVPFPEQSLFFGGVHMVQLAAHGELRGAGDPRRGGTCIVV